MFARGTGLPVMKPLTRKAQSLDRTCDTYIHPSNNYCQDTIMIERESNVSSGRERERELYWQDLWAEKLDGIRLIRLNRIDWTNNREEERGKKKKKKENSLSRILNSDLWNLSLRSRAKRAQQVDIDFS